MVFEKNLTSNNDITIFARSNYSNSSVEVYEKDQSELIASFGIINEDKKYRILLTNLNGIQDTFDLKIVGNPVEFDYIVDPTVDSVSSFTGVCGSSPTFCIFSHTVNKLSQNSILVVGVSPKGGTTVSSVTYDNQSLTEIRSDDDGGNSHSSLWYIVDPSNSTNNVNVTL